MEPYRLWRWKPKLASQDVPFFTCARPGRAKGNNRPVPDAIVDQWIRGLPGGTSTALISLLGRKGNKQGKSEFSFYSFYGPWDREDERRNRPSFQQWLDCRPDQRHIQVIEHPTFDCVEITPTTRDAVVRDISRLLSEGRTVILMDSGGISRTGSVCRHMGFTRID